MATEKKLSEKDAYEIADEFALASARVLEFRVKNRTTLSDKDDRELEKCEDQLDQMVVIMRGYGIRLIAERASTAAREIKEAVEGAKTTLEKIKKVKDFVKLATALVDLAVAITTKDAKKVASSLKAVKASADDSSRSGQ